MIDYHRTNARSRFKCRRLILVRPIIFRSDSRPFNDICCTDFITGNRSAERVDFNLLYKILREQGEEIRAV